MKRAVITGMGIVSSIGNNVKEVLESLKAGKSGINFSEQFAEMKLRSNVWGDLKMVPSEHIDRKKMRFMGDAAAFAYLSMEQAIEDAGLTEDQVTPATVHLTVHISARLRLARSLPPMLQRDHAGDIHGCFAFGKLMTRLHVHTPYI